MFGQLCLEQGFFYLEPHFNMLFEGQESLVGLRIIPIFWSRSKKRLF